MCAEMMWCVLKQCVVCWNDVVLRAKMIAALQQAPKDEVAVKPVGGTKMEQEILQKTLGKHRAGIIVKQVAAGREFKGQPFYSKPDTIHFKVNFSRAVIYMNWGVS